MNGHLPPARETAGNTMHGMAERLSPRQRQYALLGLILAGGVGLLWLILTLNSGQNPPTDAAKGPSQPGSVTNIGVMPPGGQVNPVDQWVGTAGRKLAQYEFEREEQNRLNKERSAFEQRTMQRFAELEQKLTSASQAASTPAPQPASPPAPMAMPPADSLPARPTGSGASTVGMPPGTPDQTVPPAQPAASEAPRITRLTISPRARVSESSRGIEFNS